MTFFKNKKTSGVRPSFLVSQDDLFSDLDKKKGSTLFLGKYTLREAAIVLKKKSFAREAQKRKLWPINVELDSSEFPPLQRLKMFYKDNRPENLVVDLKIREGRFKPVTDPPLKFSFLKFDFLVLEWLTLQNPNLPFSGDKTPLPGQNYRGLNLGKKIIDLFVYLARLNRNDGILAFPAYFHNALLFSRNYHFINPEKKAEVQTIRKSFSHISFKQLAWIVHLNCLRDKENNIYKWKGEAQVYPLNKEMEKYFISKEYTEMADEKEKKLRYSIDWSCYWEKINKIK